LKTNIEEKINTSILAKGGERKRRRIRIKKKRRKSRTQDTKSFTEVQCSEGNSRRKKLSGEKVTHQNRMHAKENRGRTGRMQF